MICSCKVQCQVTLEQPSFISQKKVEEAKRVPASIHERAFIGMSYESKKNMIIFSDN